MSKFAKFDGQLHEISHWHVGYLQQL